MKVLQVLGSLNRGGMETFIVNVHQAIDKNSVQFDYYLSEKNTAYEDLVRSLGAKVFYGPLKSKHPIKYMIDLCKLIKKEEYETVHIHASDAMAVIPAFATKICHVKQIIVHSHNTTSEINQCLKIVAIFFLNICVTKRLACSEKAGEWMFGSKNRKATIINNAIDCERFKFSRQIRNNIRKKIGCKSQKIIIHIGRFSMQKNHRYLIRIFEKLIKTNQEYYLVLVGDGELKKEIEQYCIENNLMNYVSFIGVVDNVQDYLFAADLFLFPSFYEGLPVTLIEAQCSGIPCIISDRITNAVQVTDLVTYIDIDENEEKIAQYISELKDFSKDRAQYANRVKKNFDIQAIAKQLERIYLCKNKKSRA